MENSLEIQKQKLIDALNNKDKSPLSPPTTKINKLKLKSIKSTTTNNSQKEINSLTKKINNRQSLIDKYQIDIDTKISQLNIATNKANQNEININNKNTTKLTNINNKNLKIISNINKLKSNIDNLNEKIKSLESKLANQQTISPIKQPQNKNLLLRQNGINSRQLHQNKRLAKQSTDKLKLQTLLDSQNQSTIN